VGQPFKKREYHIEVVDFCFNTILVFLTMKGQRLKCLLSDRGVDTFILSILPNAK
jgi:hypothetical protein